MSRIFISYSRKDRAFATTLFDALEASGRDAWLDSKDIPPTAEWMAEIERSIESADAFVFVISPDSLRSEVCARELEHAIAHHKRLIPMVRREPGGEKVSDELKKLNWIFCREDDLFEDAFSSLQTSLDTDLVYVRADTRLLVRALEWEDKGRSGSFTLRGEDLRAAEVWLAEGADKEPNPAQLQVEYITFSRQAERVRQRRTLSAVVVALVVTTGLAIVAFWQTQLATSREHARATSQAIAEEERRIAISGKLATQSRLMFDEQLDLSLLLAVLSGQINPTTESTSALHDALEHRPDLVQYLSGVPLGGVTKMAYTPNGEELVALGIDGAIWRWELSSGKPVGEPIQNPEQFVLTITISPEGETWVTGLEETGVSVWEATSGELLGPPIPFTEDWDGDGQIEYPHIATLSPDGNTLATAIYEEITLWDVPTGQMIGISDVLLGFPPSALEFSPDGGRLASAGNEWNIYFWDPFSALNISNWPTTQTRNITSLAFSADGRYVASGSEDGTVNLFDLSTGEQRIRQPEYSITTGQEIPPPALGHPAAVRSLVLSPDGEWLVSGAEDGNMLVWNTNTLTPISAPKPAYVGPVRALAYHSAGASFAAGGGNGSITLWQPAQTLRLAQPKSDTELEINFHHDVTSSMPLEGQQNLSATQPNGGYTAETGCDTPVESYEPCPSAFVNVYDANGQPVDLQPVALSSWPNAITFSEDGAMLAMTACQSQGGFECPASDIWIWSLLGGEVQQFVTSVVRVKRILFSPDNQYLAYGGEGMEIMLLNLYNEKETRLSLIGLPGEVTGLAFSPDGGRLGASASFQDPGPYANTIQHSRLVVWDTASGQVIAHTNMPGITAGDLGFNEDGSLLEYFTYDGGAYPFYIWQLGRDRWQELACRIANRDLTEEEWERYVIGEIYRQVCP